MEEHTKGRLRGFPAARLDQCSRIDTVGIIIFRFVSKCDHNSDRRRYESDWDTIACRIRHGWLTGKRTIKLRPRIMGRKVSSKRCCPLCRVLYPTARIQAGPATFTCIRSGLGGQPEAHSQRSGGLGIATDAGWRAPGAKRG